MRPWVLPFVAGATAVALIATSIGLIVQTRRAAAAEERAEQLASEVDQLRERVRDLEAGRAPDDDGAGLGGLLDGLLDGSDGLGGLLGGLLGGGDLGGLIGADAQPGMACMVADGGLSGGLPGLLGDGGLDGLLDGDLGGLLGDGGLGGLLGREGNTGASPAEPLPDDPDALVAALVPQVAADRGLAWTDPVEVDFLTGTQLRERLDALLAEDADPARDDAYERLLVALGAVPPDTDLAAVRRELLGEQVAGFYAPDTGELVVRVPDDGAVGTLDKITLVHELQHALADQALGLPDLEALEGSDRILAAQAVVEGDATLFMNRWALRNVAVEDQLEAATGEDAARAQAGLDGVPPYLQRELLFPYTEGLDWVCDRWLENGWDGVDAAYADPPTTTAEILFGAHAGPPDDLAGPAAPDGFDELLRDEFGAAPLLWLFEAPGGDETAALPEARLAASAWAGGAVTVSGNGDATAVGVTLGDGTGTLCEDVASWYAAAFPDASGTTSGAERTFRSARQAAVLVCEDRSVQLGIGPDADVARAAAG
ncbi:hypothetical protein [Egicoccus sp. AB-alg6-2]|uniref:hypothetical protein n=1 Tax=Egicoccus sp. AB-alg6-2 TaxID=3242692 RepID=UPI00359D4B5A